MKNLFFFILAMLLLHALHAVAQSQEPTEVEYYRNFLARHPDIYRVEALPTDNGGIEYRVTVDPEYLRKSRRSTEDKQQLRVQAEAKQVVIGYLLTNSLAKLNRTSVVLNQFIGADDWEAAKHQAIKDVAAGTKKTGEGTVALTELVWSCIRVGGAVTLGLCIMSMFSWHKSEVAIHQKSGEWDKDAHAKATQKVEGQLDVKLGKVVTAMQQALDENKRVAAESDKAIEKKLDALSSMIIARTSNGRATKPPLPKPEPAGMRKEDLPPKWGEDEPAKNGTTPPPPDTEGGINQVVDDAAKFRAAADEIQSRPFLTLEEQVGV